MSQFTWDRGLACSDYVQGEIAGAEAVTLNTNQIPAHTHSLLTSKDEQTTNRPDGAYPTVGGIYATTQDGAAPMAPPSSVGGARHTRTGSPSSS